MKDVTKTELDNMMKQGIIRRVSEPIEWVNSQVYIRNSTGKLHQCLDPNGSKQSHYPMPSQNSHNGGARIQTLRCQVLLQNGCKEWILVDQARSRITATDPPSTLLLEGTASCECLLTSSCFRMYSSSKWIWFWRDVPVNLDLQMMS